MLRHYTLEGRTPVLADTSTTEKLLAWAQWYETAERSVALDVLPLARVSTIFLGVDHNHWGDGPPILFETMVFVHPALRDTSPMHGLQRRSCTWDEALGVHAEAMRELLSAHQEAAG